MPPTKRPPGRTIASRTVRGPALPESIVSLVEQLVNRVLKPLDLVIIPRQRIHELLGEAAERGRVTRTDADNLASELIRRGLDGTDDLLAQIRNLGRGRGEAPLPIEDYQELTARQAIERLRSLDDPGLRTVEDYERRHANRKSVLDAIRRELTRR